MPVISCKWSGLLVVGKDITEEQAMEINIRTASLSYLSSNDRAFVSRVYRDALGFSYDPTDFSQPYSEESYAEFQKCLDSLGYLGLEYLSNHNIVSCWVGGPHGWCSWEGKILANTYNIGKWPEYNEVLDEWIRIAEAFPFLDLRSQLLNDEICEVGTPIVEFVIKDGRVDVIENPTRPLGPCKDVDYTRMGDVSFERGATLDKIKKAVEITRKAVKGKEKHV